MTRIVVDFPAPLGPRKPVTRPGRAVNVTSSTAVKPPYVLVRESTVIMGSTVDASGTLAHQGSREPHPARTPELTLRSALSRNVCALSTPLVERDE